MKFNKFDWFDSSELNAVKRVMKSKKLSEFYGNWGEKFEGGIEVKSFESECEEYFQVKHAITFNSLASGLSASIGALGISPGDEVILPPWTMSATAASILHWGGIPIFADINPDTYCIEPTSVEANITTKTKAIIAVDIFGQSANVESLQLLARKFNLKLISDSAQSIGARRNGAFTGTKADIGGISLNYHKHIHSGEGAVMFTNDSDLALRLKLIRNHAESVVADIPFKVDFTNMVGHNYRMSELHASIGRVQLKKLNSILIKRKKEADLLRDKLKNIDQLVMPFVDFGNEHVYYIFAMQIAKSRVSVSKQVLVNELVELGVPGLSTKYVNLHLLPVFQKKIALGSSGFPWSFEGARKGITYEKGICPVAERLQDDTFLSFYINDFSLSKKNIDFIYSAFRKTFDKYSL